MLADVYESIERPATSLLDMFYGRLSRYVHEDPETTPVGSLEDATSKLFSDLFPVVYRTVAVAFDKLDNASQFDEDYVQCLVGKSFDIRPFGDVPYMLSKDISRTFSATNVLVHALRWENANFDFTVQIVTVDRSVIEWSMPVAFETVP